MIDNLKRIRNEVLKFEQPDDFSWDEDDELNGNLLREEVLVTLNHYRQKYNETKDMKYFRRISR